MKKQALTLAQLGIRVIPIRPKNKIPAISNWPAQASTNPDIIERWFGQGDYNLGIATGPESNLLVVDVDDKNALTHYPWLKVKTPIAITNNGYHLYFKWSAKLDGIPTTKVRPLPGIDVRGKGGQVVAPPSIHPSGHIYRWADGLSITDVPLADAPQELIQALTGQPECTQPADEWYVPGGVDWDALEASGAPAGQRNATLAGLVGSLYSRGISHQEVTNRALAFGARCTPPMDEREIMTVVESISRRERQRATAPITIPATTPATGRATIDKDEVVKHAICNHEGVCLMLSKLYKGGIVYDTNAGRWYVFDNHHWHEDTTGEVQSLLKTVKDMYVEAANGLRAQAAQTKGETGRNKLESLAKEVRKAAKALEKHPYRTQVLKQAGDTSEYGLTTSGHDWEDDPWLLAVKNGVVDLRTGQLRPGRPEDMIRHTAPTEFNPSAECPLFERALTQIFANDTKLIRFFQRVVGMSLIGRQIEHKLVILYGQGRNGKDTLIFAVNHALGKHYMAPIRAEALLIDNRTHGVVSGSSDADTVALQGLRIAYCSEVEDGARLSAAKVKRLTGGGEITARAPYARAAVSFIPSHTLWLLTNTKPHAHADDYALWERIILIPFTQSFVPRPIASHEHRADEKLPEKLEAEAEGILRWCIEGCLAYQREGLVPPDVVVEAVEAYREEEDVIGQFVKDCCVIRQGLSVQAGALYQTYHTWATEQGMRPLSVTAFGRLISKRFEKRKGRDTNAYFGLTITGERGIKAKFGVPPDWVK